LCNYWFVRPWNLAQWNKGQQEQMATKH
jgi:hypothetical protein